MEKHECWGCEYTAMLERGEIAPERIIYNSEHTFAVDAPWEYSEERVAVQPKKHIATIHDLTSEDDEIVLDLMEAIKAASQYLIDKKGGCEVLMNQGKFQNTKHIHIHVCYGIYET
ncbi:MAG: HIT domain-containing protein [Defluviitaleaceae bacterium]|nr:HIT domain-containing protein [Defluviitaleaceae bacterium]